jgi:hypothetical protein
VHVLGRRRVERDDGAPPVVWILAAVDEAVCLELGRQLARRRERDAHSLGNLAHRLRPLGADLGQRCDVPPAERGLARDERQQFRVAAAAPEPAHDLPKGAAELRELRTGHIGNTCLLLTVIIG